MEMAADEGICLKPTTDSLEDRGTIYSASV